MSSWSYNPNCFLDAKRLTYRIPSESGLDLSQKLQMLEGGRGERGLLERMEQDSGREKHGRDTRLGISLCKYPIIFVS